MIVTFREKKKHRSEAGLKTLRNFSQFTLFAFFFPIGTYEYILAINLRAYILNTL